MSENNKRPWKRIGIEIFSIVFAVILALVMNEWRQSYNRHRDVAQALKLVRGEIIENRKGMERTIANQIAYRDSFSTIIFSKSKNRLKNKSFAKIYFDMQRQIQKGLRIAPILSTAWITAKELGIIQDIDYSLAMAFSEMEEQNRLINFLFQAMAKIFYGQEFFEQGSAEKLSSTAFMVLSDLITAEQELIKMYDKILENIE